MEKFEFDKFLHEAGVNGRMENLNGGLSVSGVSIDSRTIRPGEIFIALRGENFDGYRFIASAYEKGAVATVVQEGHELSENETGIPVLFVRESTDFLMQLAAWYRRQFSIPVIGLTGSAGKTTAKELLASVLRTKYRVVKTEGNKNNFVGVPLSLFHIMHNTEAGVFELGTNHPGEIARLTEIVSPTHGVVTNIGSGHIGYFGSKEAIYREKRSLLDGVSKDGRIYINEDDPLLRRYRREGVTIKKIGLSEGVDYHGLFSGMDGSGSVRFRVNDGPEILLPIPGKHHLMNGLLAAAIGLDLGISPDQVKEGLESVPPVHQRMEMLHSKNILFINDAYNSNPESLIAAIDFLRSLPAQSKGRRFLVLGDMLELGDLGEQEHHKIGEYLKQNPVDFVFSMGQLCRIIDETLRTGNGNPAQTEWFVDYKSLADALAAAIRDGDVVLVKGSRGMAMENVFTYLGIRG